MKTLVWSITHLNSQMPVAQSPGPISPGGPKGMREDEVLVSFVGRQVAILSMLSTIAISC